MNLTCKDGYQLDAILFSPSTDAKAFIIFQGGTGVKKEFYSNFCNYLSEQGFYVLLYDYRGIGGSKHGSLKGMKANLIDVAQLDMQSALQWAADNYPSLKKLLVGHSLGTQLVGFIPNNNLLSGIIGINSSTGTWWKMQMPRNFYAAFLWYVVNPLLTPLFGYAPLKRLGVMEDLPKNVINQWSRWCRSNYYFGSHLGKSIKAEYFKPPAVPFTIHYFSDDYIATHKTVSDLLHIHKDTPTKMIKHFPKDYGAKKIGHFGIFSRKYRESFWNRIAEDLKSLLG